MNREYFENYSKTNFEGKSQILILEQIESFYDCLSN